MNENNTRFFFRNTRENPVCFRRVEHLCGTSKRKESNPKLICSAPSFLSFFLSSCFAHLVHKKPFGYSQPRRRERIHGVHPSSRQHVLVLCEIAVLQERGHFRLHLGRWARQTRGAVFFGQVFRGEGAPRGFSRRGVSASCVVLWGCGFCNEVM